ncbi:MULTISPECIES: AraC family transcriptional regulator [Shewanella]|uniref:AraC family transcriptional regulator n=2 Tax=Shewanella TaxID=22 RepID=A0ABQ2RFR8_9GAMM|nr:MULTISPECIES: AraC family transcriptional regulator [Shewanella]MCL1103381.1 AraC family transcriptional regulator [Shewanella saliphila]GGP69143.1 AraC family transcriptional regulator [Shewanella saliphila]GGQ27205.1 AraC family transcriptional regulator [Shewanella litoralis]
MIKQKIKQLVEQRISADGIVETAIKGVSLFKITQAMPCAPAVYEPTVVVILNGRKEAILDGDRYIYDNSQYMCCTVSLPVEAGTPEASPEEPLLGVYISLDTKVMTELAIEMESATGAIKQPKSSSQPQGLSLANWDDTFADALLRLLQLDGSMDASILGESRLRELYYAVLKGDAGISARRAFGIGNEIARSIEYLSLNLGKNVTIDDLASLVGMSRAVFHRKFKQATRMSPIQFMKSMRLNHAAMRIVAGMNVSEAAMKVGYVSSSQFSREFKRMYGTSPKQWSQSKALIEHVA